ncbi:hypothetical protein [Actinoplanes sp. NPDC049316]|uniref:hypothetical protein n=1 Tax=Actinoplanes sp. NPDC049316 TaxID=3154727 RepID=UPI003439A11B
MNAEHDVQTVAVVGPPASGKTTVARLIAASTGGRYLNMPDLTQLADRESWLNTDAQPAGAHDATVLVLAAALRHHALTEPGSVVVLDNLVTSSACLDLFATCDPADRVRLHVVELDARDLTLLGRAQNRICSACQPDPNNEPLQPASTEAGRQPTCASCSRPLSIRTRGEPMTFEQRLFSYREQHSALRRTTDHYRFPWTHIETTEPAERCAEHAVMAITGRPASQGKPKRPPAQRRPTS